MEALVDDDFNDNFSTQEVVVSFASTIISLLNETNQSIRLDQLFDEIP